MFSRSSQVLAAVAIVAGGLSSAQAEGLYVGGSLGHPDYSSSVNGIGGHGADSSGVGADNGGIGAKLYGGYQITPNFSLETGLFRLGHSRQGALKVNTWGASVDAVGNYMFAPQWSVLGKLGGAEARFDTSLGNDSSPALKAGAGIQYDFSRQVAFRVEYERYHFINAFDAKPNAGEFSAGIRIGF